MRLAAGAFLATAGDHGLRVYAWDDVLHVREQMPGPRFQAEAELVEDEGETRKMGMKGTCALAPDLDGAATPLRWQGRQDQFL